MILKNLLESEKKGTKGRVSPWSLVWVSAFLVAIFLKAGSPSSQDATLRPMAHDERVGVEAVLDKISQNEKLRPVVEGLKKKLEKSTWWVESNAKELVSLSENRIIFNEHFFDIDSFSQQLAILPLINQPISSLFDADDELAALED
jgi:hypothetical protein